LARDGAAQSSESAIARATQFLAEHCNEPVSIDQLCAVTGLSRFYLIHEFTRALGCAPHAYHIHMRIERARRLLQQGVPASQVAATLGFADQSHFNRHFKRVMRVTPGAYARAAQQQ
jgi:AraC-like DNA-binding protein